eukprot:726108_1
MLLHIGCHDMSGLPSTKVRIQKPNGIRSSRRRSLALSWKGPKASTSPDQTSISDLERKNSFSLDMCSTLAACGVTEPSRAILMKSVEPPGKPLNKIPEPTYIVTETDEQIL